MFRALQSRVGAMNIPSLQLPIGPSASCKGEAPCFRVEDSCENIWLRGELNYYYPGISYNTETIVVNSLGTYVIQSGYITYNISIGEHNPLVDEYYERKVAPEPHDHAIQQETHAPTRDWNPYREKTIKHRLFTYLMDNGIGRTPNQQDYKNKFLQFLESAGICTHIDWKTHTYVVVQVIASKKDYCYNLVGLRRIPRPAGQGDFQAYACCEAQKLAESCPWLQC